MIGKRKPKRPTGFTPEQKQKIRERDGDRCLMRDKFGKQCPNEATEANHRSNRGMGGSREKNRISNGCAICHQCNGLIESNADIRAIAVTLGIKIGQHDDPTRKPLHHPDKGAMRLDDEGGWEPFRKEHAWDGSA